MTTTDLQQIEAESLAQRFHETYERLAPSFGYETRKASAVPWENVPEQNRKLMVAVCSELLIVPAKAQASRREGAYSAAHEADCLCPFCGMKRENEALRVEVADWKQGSDVEARAADEAREQVGRLREALVKISTLSQEPNHSFTSRATKATDIATEALSETEGVNAEISRAIPENQTTPK